ncbi:hypothetical protein FRB99_007863 [Tulasnella sp. 403]|nr:hypothetical protein FRB99_007863 [Tulasnella sp. 403]
MDNKADPPFHLCSQESVDSMIQQVYTTYIPLLTAAGHLSKKQPKKIIIHFHNAFGTGDTTGSDMVKRGKRKGSPGTALLSATKDAPAAPSDTATQLENEVSRVIELLKAYWFCEGHTTNVGSMCYCWPQLPGSPTHWVLTHASLNLWTLEIIAGSTTVDEKPAHVNFHDVKPHVPAKP